MPIGKRVSRRSAGEPSSVLRTGRQDVAPADGEVVEATVERVADNQDLKVLMIRTLDHRHRASQALARLRSLQQTVFGAATTGKTDIERKMEAALEEYRTARFSALRARRRLLDGLNSGETC
jgi:hypothetical protein